MKVFKKFPEKSKCPICNTNENKDCVLIGICGTQDGNIVEAELFHLDCIELTYDKESNVIYQVLK